MAFLRVRTTSGEWLAGAFAGAFAGHSYAGQFPHEKDLWLEQAWPIADDGTFGDEPLGYPVYIPAATISYIEVVPSEREQVDD